MPHRARLREVMLLLSYDICEVAGLVVVVVFAIRHSTTEPNSQGCTRVKIVADTLFFWFVLPNDT
jgi:hypothetical protein